ncbi:MAG: hypothetical protein J6562_03900 [Candidatus Schmidhempelia sp.]|nr:hypothetical protein [Candidatus Schmidhempelia sp.]
MLMADIRDYLQLIGRANLRDLALRFQIQESAMEQMLAFWIKKGFITQHHLTQDSCRQGTCSDCFECSEGLKKIYIWRNKS